MPHQSIAAMEKYQFINIKLQVKINQYQHYCCIAKSFSDSAICVINFKQNAF